MNGPKLRRLQGLILAASVGLASPVVAQDRVVNPFVATYGAGLDVEEIDLRIDDGLLPGHQDRAAWTYIERVMPVAQREAFNTRAPGLTRPLAAERMAEFLAVENLQGRLADDSAIGRKVRLVVHVDEARADSMARMLLAPLPVSKFPRMAMQVTVQDLATGRTLAAGRIEQIESYAGDNVEARDRLNLDYSLLGTDTHFQILAGMSNALAASLETLMRVGETPNDKFTVGQASITPGINVPIRMNRAVYMIEVAPLEDDKGEE